MYIGIQKLLIAEIMIKLLDTDNRKRIITPTSNLYQKTPSHAIFERSI